LQVWYCTSSRSHTTISKYAEYLATSYKEAKEKLGEDFSVNPKVRQIEISRVVDPDHGVNIEWRPHPLYISADVSTWRSYMCNRLPSSGEVYIFQRVLGQREEGGMIK
jgi:hypothetical protein